MIYPNSRSTAPEAAVQARYSAAAQAVEPARCCPVSYDRDFLKVIPEEVLAKDYGCGDPSPFVNAGETVVDLGSGAGKLAFIRPITSPRVPRSIGSWRPSNGLRKDLTGKVRVHGSLGQ